MSRIGAAALLTAALVNACERGAPGATPAPSTSSPLSPGAPRAPGAPRTSAATPPPVGSGAPTPLGASLDVGRLTKLAFDGGAWVGELARTPPARVWVTLATRDQPLAPRARAAHFRIAERIFPGLVAPTTLRAVGLAELSRAADAATRKRLEQQARVLADGTVEAALTLAPAPSLTRVELTRLGEDSPVQAWETSLAARELAPDAVRATLAQYQALLVIDYVSGNAARIAVHRHDKSGRITAAEGNEAFSPRPKEGAQNDAFVRLSRHMTYSKELDSRLGGIDREELERALRWGEPPTLLVTPKQVDECVERIRNVRRLIAERVKQRGAEQALALP